MTSILFQATYGTDFRYVTLFQTNQMKYGRLPNFYLMEDDLNFYLFQWKTTYICLKMEDNLNVLKMKDDPNFFKHY